VFPHLGLTDIPFSSYPLKAKYVELMGKDKGYNSNRVYCQVKGWSKKSCEIFSNDFVKRFWNAMMEPKKMGSYKKDFEVAMLFSSQNIDFPFLFEETLGAFLFLSFSLPLFSILFLSFLCSVSLRIYGFWWYLRRKIAFENSLQMAWDDMANPWLWRWGSSGYISGGRIFLSGVMHANILGWG
jgi:hypothetical protein